MNKRRIYLVVFILVLLSILSSSVYAQNMLDTVLTPFEKINIGATYEAHWYIVDCIMYFIILVGVAQFVFSNQFKDKGGKAIIIGMGVSLAIAASYFEYKQNFHLLEAFGPIAVIVVILVFLVGIYKFAQALGAGGRGFSMLAFSFLFFYIMGQMPTLANWFAANTSEFIRLVWALLNLLAIIFLVWGVIDLFSSLAGLGGGGGGGEGGRGGFWDNFFRRRGDRGDGGGRGGRDGGRGPGDREPEEPEYDERNLGEVEVTVTDVRDNPIEGAVVTITGRRSGKPWHRAFWRRRGPYLHLMTGEQGTVHFPGVPSGHLRLEVTRPGWHFYEMLIRNRTTTHFYVRANEPNHYHVRLTRMDNQPLPQINLRGERPGEFHIGGRID